LGYKKKKGAKTAEIKLFEECGRPHKEGRMKKLKL
jgi:hypothetical protein